MSIEQISHLKEQLAALTPQDKLEVARFLFDQARLEAAAPDSVTAAADHSTIVNKRTQHLAWLKAHREQYSGQYVALDDDRLASSGATMREAHIIVTGLMMKAEWLRMMKEHPSILI